MRLIDADALQEWVKKYTSVFARYDWRDILQMIRNAPTVDAEPVKHGKWLDADDGIGCTCSICGYDAWTDTPFCPNCGAKMDGERREDAE